MNDYPEFIWSNEKYEGERKKFRRIRNFYGIPDQSWAKHYF